MVASLVVIFVVVEPPAITPLAHGASSVQPSVELSVGSVQSPVEKSVADAWGAPMQFEYPFTMSLLSANAGLSGDGQHSSPSLFLYTHTVPMSATVSLSTRITGRPSSTPS